MKLVHIFFSIYFLTLAIIPCHDAEDFGMGDKHEKNCLQKDNSCSDSKDETCSPFCTCNCCGVNIVVFPFSEVPIMKMDLNNSYLVYQQNPTSEIFYSIWLPPKIS